MGEASYVIRKQEIETKVKEKLHKDNKRFGKFCQKERCQISTTFNSPPIIIGKKIKIKNKETIGKEEIKIRYEESETTTLIIKI